MIAQAADHPRLRRLLPVALASAALLAAAIATSALPAAADGGFVWRAGADLAEPAQRALIHWEAGAGREVLVLQVTYEGPVEDFAWIVPVPSRPDVDAIPATESPFAELSVRTQRRLHDTHKMTRIDGYRVRGLGKRESVEVLERKVAGIYDVAVLAAADGKALSAWLNAHGYAFPADRSEVLDSYARRGWTHVALRIDAAALKARETGADEEGPATPAAGGPAAEPGSRRTELSGALQPLRLGFDAPGGPVYPLEISSINAGSTEILLYVLGDRPWLVSGKYADRFAPDGGTLPPVFQAQDEVYGTFHPEGAKALPLTWRAVGLPPETTRYLCKHRASLAAAEMTEDLRFRALDPVPFWTAYMEACLRGERHSPELAAWMLLQHGVLDWLDVAAHPLERVRMLAARNCHRDLPAKGLRLLSEDPSEEVRDVVARHSEAPAPLLARLASDPSRRVLWNVARNPGTPPDVLRQLHRDHGDELAAPLRFNPATPADVRRALEQ